MPKLNLKCLESMEPGTTGYLAVFKDGSMFWAQNERTLRDHLNLAPDPIKYIEFILKAERLNPIVKQVLKIDQLED